MHESASSNENKPESGWLLTSEPQPVSEHEAPIALPGPPPDIRGQCLLFCNRCGQPSDGGSEFCLRCGAKRCVNCGE